MDKQILEDALILDMKKQSQSYHRFPVRFISLTLGQTTTSDLSFIAKRFNCTIIELSKQLYHDDAWLTKESVLNVISEAPNNENLLVVGLSELVKFYSYAEFESIILSFVTDFENSTETKQRRIYFACFELIEQLQKVINSLYNKGRYFNPLIDCRRSSNVDVLPVYLLAPSIDLAGLPNIIHDTNDWLNIWRATDISWDKPLICYSQTLFGEYSKAQPDNVFEMKKITDYMVCANKLFGFVADIKYKNGEEGYWRQLITYLSTHQLIGENTYKTICSMLNVSDLSIKNLTSCWYTNNQFERWLIKLYLSSAGNNDYFSQVVLQSDINEKNSLTKMAWLHIFNCDISFANERKYLLEVLLPFMANTIPESELHINYNKLLFEYITSIGSSEEDIKDIDFCSFAVEQLSIVVKAELNYVREGIKKQYTEVYKKLLTTYTKVEKRIFLSLFQNKIINLPEISSYWENVAWYFDDASKSIIESSLLSTYDYIYMYRQCRFNIESVDKLVQYRMDIYNSEDGFYKWYYSLKTPREFIQKQDYKGKVFVWDGVGSEYLDLIICLIKSKSRHVLTTTIARSGLPSITDISKLDMSDDYIWINDFDRDVIHGDIYNSTSNILKALMTIEKLLQTTLNLAGDEPFAIIADHGSTIAHKLIKTKKKYNFEASEHGGRCMKLIGNEDILASPDYLICEATGNDKDKWLIAFNETSLGNTSKYEVHGGALIEEISVPVIIVAERKPGSKNEYYSVDALKLDISGLDRIVSFRILPAPTNPPIMIDGSNKRSILNNSGSFWNGELTTGKTQTVTIEVGGQKFEFKAKTKSISNLGDGFNE